MAGEAINMGATAAALPPDDRDGGGWLLRTLKPGEQVLIAGCVRLELRITDKGRARIAISAPREVRVAFPPKLS